MVVDMKLRNLSAKLIIDRRLSEFCCPLVIIYDTLEYFAITIYIIDVQIVSTTPNWPDLCLT